MSQLLTVEEAARYIGRSRSSLDKWRARKEVLPFYRDGNKVFYNINDLDEYLKSIRVEVNNDRET